MAKLAATSGLTNADITEAMNEAAKCEYKLTCSQTSKKPPFYGLDQAQPVFYTIMWTVSIYNKFIWCLLHTCADVCRSK